MKISSRSHYALIALIELAQKPHQTICVRKIAEKHNLSVVFLEKIFQTLRYQNIVKSLRGKEGGYFLTRDSTEITLKEVLKAMGENTRINPCANQGKCLQSKQQCSAHVFLNFISDKLEDLFRNLTLKDLLSHQSLNVLILEK